MNFVVLGAMIIGTSILVLLGAPDVFASIPLLGGLVKFTTMPIANFTPSKVTQLFKPPPNGHNGIDIAVPIGTPVLCVAPGVVVNAVSDPKGSSGRFVIMKGRAPFTPTIGWGYAHLSRVDVVVGQELEPGDVIGLSGNSGLTQSSDGELIQNRTDGRGAHLHFTTLDVPRGFQSIDPEPFLPESIRKETPNA